MSDSIELEKKFKSEINVSSWSLLKPHHKKQSLFIVEKRLSLVQMAIDISMDDIHSVKKAMELQLLRYPTTKEVDTWELNEEDDIAAYLIVQPYVLIQLKDT